MRKLFTRPPVFLWLVVVSFFMGSSAFAQGITGTVTSTDAKNGIPGASVTIKGTTNGTVTNADGQYTLRFDGKSGTLVVSSVGYLTKELPISGQTTINVTLEPDTKALNEVVVIGYGTARKTDITGAVTSLTAKNLDERPVLRVDQALVGQLAGVQVKQTSGALGKGMSVQVRGSGSITAGNEPLYVIDGFPLATATPNGSGNFGTGNPLDNMNPNDIESVQVLKDAAAAAIYGSRAANGVVLITTKRGQTGKSTITMNAYAGYMERSRKLDMLNGPEWIERATEIINGQWVASGAGRTATQTNAERRAILGLSESQVNTTYMTDDRWTQAGYPGLRFHDWQDEAFRKGAVQNYQLSASGGTDNVNYYVSGNYVQQQGMVINTDYTAYSARANVEVKASKNLKFGVNLAPTYSINHDPGVEGKDNILHQLLSYSPVQEESAGSYPNSDNIGQYRWSTSANSPIAKLERTIGETKRVRTLGSLYGEYQLAKGLFWKTTLNLDNTDNTAKGYTPYSVASSLEARNAQQTILTSGSFSTYRKRTFVNENTLSFSRVFAEKHDLSLLGGISYTSDKFEASDMRSNGGFSNNAITTLNAANGITGSTSEARNVLISFFGRAQYNYDSKYLFTASVRQDGSSRFGSNTRWGVFPSASVGWRISQEEFMQSITAINDLKLRASWGTSGNYNIGDYSTLPTLGTYNYSFNGVNAIGQAPAGVINSNLSWEKSQTFDVGLDFTILRNRLSASFDVYSKTNTALLLNVPILAVTGFNSALGNAGSVRNQGWELQLNTTNTTGAFKWTTSLNFSHNANKVLTLAGGQSQTLIPSSFDISHSILRVGDPLYSIYVVRQIGILSQEDINNKVALFGSQVAGDPRYLDANGDGVIDANDRVIVGQPNPKYTWGITNNFRYKNFDLSVLVQGQNGGSIYSLLGRALNRTGQGVVDNALGYYRDRWRSAENPGAGVVGKAYSTFGRIKNTDWLYSSNYVRVRNITLGYNLKSIVKVPQIQGARIFVTAENFFGWDKYKGGLNPEATNTNLSGDSSYPEAGDYGGLPIARSLIFGVNLTF